MLYLGEGEKLGKSLDKSKKGEAFPGKGDVVKTRFPGR